MPTFRFGSLAEFVLQEAIDAQARRAGGLAQAIDEARTAVAACLAAAPEHFRLKLDKAKPAKKNPIGFVKRRLGCLVD